MKGTEQDCEEEATDDCLKHQLGERTDTREGSQKRLHRTADVCTGYTEKLAGEKERMSSPGHVKINVCQNTRKERRAHDLIDKQKPMSENRKRA